MRSRRSYDTDAGVAGGYRLGVEEPATFAAGTASGRTRDKLRVRNRNTEVPRGRQPQVRMAGKRRAGGNTRLSSDGWTFLYPCSGLFGFGTLVLGFCTLVLDSWPSGPSGPLYTPEMAFFHLFLDWFCFVLFCDGCVWLFLSVHMAVYLWGHTVVSGFNIMTGKRAACGGAGPRYICRWKGRQRNLNLRSRRFVR